MNGHYFKKLIQAVKNGGIIYAIQKVRLYLRRRSNRKEKFSWDDYVFEELPSCDGQDLDNTCNVSVVVPTYNGGSQLETLFQTLKQQKKCGNVEIVIVDSGSTDGTIQLCNRYGVTMIQIPNEHFSHSTARNLGAEAARGQFLVFMTQDALPSSEEWLAEMIAPILEGEADAVSCGEECPVDTDLYYKVANYGHASFVGMLHNDVLGSKEKCKDKQTLRKFASLSDVACAIKRSTFLRFRHRYDFAEDLDLGIRLLSCGYKTKLLSGTKVIHGHSRNADYYLKRALVEKESFIKIFSETNEKEDPAIVESRIYYSACVVAEYLARLEAIECCKETSVSSFIKDAVQLFDAVIENKKNLTVFNGILHHQAPLLEEIILLCAYDLKKHPSNTDLAYSIRFYLDNLAEYLAHYNITTLENLAEEISQCMCKQFALYVGTELVKLEKEATWNDKIQELIKGV